MSLALGNKIVNNSPLGVYRIYKILESLDLVQFKDIKNKSPAEIQKFIYNIYEKLKDQYNTSTDKQLGQKILQDNRLDNDIKNIINQYFQGVYGSQRNLQQGDLLDSLFIQSICRNCEIQSHLNYKFGGVYLYQDFDKQSPKYLDPKFVIRELISNLHGIHISKEEYDQRLKQLGLDDKIDNIKQLKQQVQKISEIGFVLNTCHHYSPGQHWVSIGFQLLVIGGSKQNKKYLKIFYYDSQMTQFQRSYIGLQTEELDCECFENCPEYLKKNYYPKVEQWLKDLMKECQKNNIQYKLNPKTKLIDIQFNKLNTQNDDFSCGYHSILFQYLFAINGEALDSIQQSISDNRYNSLDHIINNFRKLLLDESPDGQHQETTLEGSGKCDCKNYNTENRTTEQRYIKVYV